MKCDTRCSMHSHEGHKCDCGCKCHKLSDAKPMTAEERAKAICHLIIHNWTPEGDDIRIAQIADQIQQACAEVLEQNEVLVKVRIEAACAEARAEGLLDGDRKLREEASKGIYTPDREAWYERRIAESYSKGFSEGRQEAAAEFKDTNSRLNAYAEKKVNEAYEQGFSDCREKLLAKVDKMFDGSADPLMTGMIKAWIRALERDK